MAHQHSVGCIVLYKTITKREESSVFGISITWGNIYSLKKSRCNSRDSDRAPGGVAAEWLVPVLSI